MRDRRPHAGATTRTASPSCSISANSALDARPSRSSSSGADDAAHEVERQRRGEEADAEITPAPNGHDQRRRAERRARRRSACTGPAPPNANSGRPRGSLPRSIGVHARGAGHALVDELVDAPGRLARRSCPSGSAMRVCDRRVARPRRSSCMPAAEEERRVEVAEHQVGVGDGRLGAAAAVAGGPGIGARAAPGRRSSSPSASTRAIEPPPAPISIMSIDRRS